VGTLTQQQRAVFDRTGILKLGGAFDGDAAARMADVVWKELQDRYGIARSDPATWNRHPPSGLTSSKRSRVFDPVLGPIGSAALDDLFGTDWTRPKHLGGVLVTMPNATEWRVPYKVWHSDFEATYQTGRLFAVKLWALITEVEPHQGGTPQLAGSHRLFARYLTTCPDRTMRPAKLGFLRSHPWLAALSTDDGDPDRNHQFMDAEVDVDGLPARVVELTGHPGDIYITHPWVFHTGAVNARRQPRIMRSVAVYANDA
jgi:hypothetical protein